MNKIYKSLIVIVFIFLTTNSSAIVHNIIVESSQFSPASVSANVGDTILWTHGAGFHTTTSTSIPVDALPWDSPISHSTQSFSYVIAKAGTYDYICTPHGFTGQIVAINTGITSPDVYSNFNMYTLRSSTYIISYTLMHSAKVKISVYDLTGKNVKVLNSSYQSAGNYLNTYYLEDLQKGIYLLEFFIGNHRTTKRLIIG